MDNNMNANQSGTEATPAMKLDVSVRPLTPQNNLVAFASVKINDCFVVEGLKVLTGKNGLFVNMPSTQDSKGEYRDVAFPVTADFRKQLETAVLDKYSITIDKMQEKVNAANEVRKNAPEKPSILGQVNESKNAIQQQGRNEAKAPKKDSIEH